MATNEVEEYKRAVRDAGEKSETAKAAYDKYATSMRKSGQTPKSAAELKP